MTSAMIQLSPRGKAIYQFLSLTVLLLLLYGASVLFSGLSRLPASPLNEYLTADALRQFSAQVFKLLCVTGFLAAGIMMADDSWSDTAITWWRRVWYASVALTIALSPFGIPQVLDSGIALVILALVLWSARVGGGSTFVRVWRLGLLLVGISLPATHLITGPWALALRAFPLQVAYALCALSIAFWLLPRISAVTRAAAQENLPIVAVTLCFGGGLICLGHLGPPGLIGLSAAPLILISYIVLAGHLARPLRNGNENASLASHWVALATILWLVGSGLLGALGAHDGISRAMRDTEILAAREWLGGWVIVAIVLAFCNEAASSLRGDNHRVTGYVPLWLIAFGVGASFIAQLCRGVAQFTLREFAVEAALSEAEALLPFTVVWLICLLAVFTGIATYAIGFFLRRPLIRVVEG